MKEKKQNQTKVNERIIKTFDVKEMFMMFLTNDICKKWTEDFIDEDTNETVSVERSELLFAKGTQVDQNIQQKINFYILDKTITEPIELSNQRREGWMVGYRYESKWMAKVYLGAIGKTRKVLLSARNPTHALSIIGDYFETRTNGFFRVIGLQVIDHAIFLEDPITHLTDTQLDDALRNGDITFVEYCDLLDNPAQDNHADEDHRQFWKITYNIGWKTKKSEGEENDQTFIVQSVNVDNARNTILRYLTTEDRRERDDATRKVDGEKVFTLSLQEATQMPISAIIPQEYTDAHRPTENEE